MRWHPATRNRALSRTAAAMSLTACCALALWVAGPVMATAKHTSRATSIIVNGTKRGALFAGVGSISGGGGISRLLIDYSPAQQNEILNYLFGPGGADLQVLKLEIAGDAAQSDGAEPAVEHTKGQIDCDSGYGWWLAEQAVARNPNITLMALQWSAPGWIGSSIWDPTDIEYIIDWLNCAKSHNLTISYVGGWNEHGYIKSWYEALRSALNANGFGSIKIIAADSFPGRHYIPARTWNVAAAAAIDPTFKAALSAYGSHDTCGGPTTGWVCESTPVARHSGLPLWESELGTLHGPTSPANMARTINNGFIQAGITGFLQWPLTASEPPGMLYTDRGLVIANQPQSGNYTVQPTTWAIAQTTQFTQVGWRHIPGASGTIGDSGNYVAYESPNRHDWSLVAENTGSHPRQTYGPQTITVHLIGGLKTSNISVWSTDLLSPDPSHWFAHRPNAKVSKGTFSYTIKPGYVVSFTSTTGQSHLRTTPPASFPMTLPYAATPDASNEAWGLDTQEGTFVYAPCLGGTTGQCIQQMADQVPVFWEVPQFGTPTPYAVVGDPEWSNYTVSSSVLFQDTSESAGLISRFDHQANDPKHFGGYEFNLRGDGAWQLLRNAVKTPATVLASGTVSGVTTGTWQTISLAASGTRLTATVNGTQVAQMTDPTYTSGLAGIDSNWSSVQFNNLTVG
jgi:hypothetical protein